MGSGLGGGAMSESTDRSFDLFNDRIPLSGRCLIEASAGTGKTYNLSGLFVRLVAENKAGAADDPSRIVVVTYTRAATRELRERITRRLRRAYELLDEQRELSSIDDDFLEDLKNHYGQDLEARKHLKRAVEQIDELSVYTIHGFAHRLLLEFGPLANIDYTGEIITDPREFTSELIYDYWRRTVAAAEDDLVARALLECLQKESGTPEGFVSEYSGLLNDNAIEFKSDFEFEKFGKLVRRIQQQFETLRDELDSNVNDELENLFNRNDEDNLQLSKRTFKPGKWEARCAALDQIKQAEYAIEVDDDSWKKLRYLGIDSIREKINNAGSFDRLPLTESTQEWMRQLEEVMKLVDELNEHHGAVVQYVLGVLNGSYYDALQERDEYSYDDVLFMADRMVREHPEVRVEIREKYPISLIDEFQDTDPLQWSMFEQVHDEAADENTLLCLIGDPKQSIYRFRGADVNAYLQARESISRENRFKLDANWRSDEAFIEAMNTLWSNHENPFFAGEAGKIDYRSVTFPKQRGKTTPLLSYQPAMEWIVDEAEDARLNKQQSRERAAEIAARHIKRLLRRSWNADGGNGTSDSSVEPGDIAVLCSRNREAALMKQKLFDHGLNSVQLSRDNVFNSREARELQLILEAAAEPTNATALRTAMGTQMLDAADLLIRQSEDEESARKLQERWEEWLERVREWHGRWTEDGLTALLRHIMEGEECIRHVLKYHNGERRATNLRHLADLLQKIARERPGEMQYLLHEFRRRRREAEDRSTSEEEELRLESDRDLVNIVTIHRSKGLEYPVVYTPFMWDGINASGLSNRRPYVYHDPDKTLKKRIDIDGNQYEGSRYYYFREEMQDQLRMVYVALTRGEHHHVMIHVPYQNNYADNGDSAYAAIDYVLFGRERYEKALHKKFGDYVKVDETEWITYPELIEQVDKLSRTSPGRVIQLTKWSDESDEEESGAIEKGQGARLLRLRPFKAPDRLRQRWVIQSYSALRRGMEESNAAFEAYNVQMDEGDRVGEEEEVVEPTEESTLHTFPPGARTGLCWHRIYEEVRFNDPRTYDQEVERQLESHGFDAERWTPVLGEHVYTTLHKSLEQAGEVRLADLKEEQISKEMEFHFGYDQADVEEIFRIIRPGETPPESHQLNRGLMNGYIDLTFEYGEKIYLLDYKSNHLGKTIEDYQPRALEDSIREHYYDLQYHLYTVALHRYLRQRIGESYSYEAHFGGAFYLFLRGIRDDKGSSGVFFDRPERDVVLALDRYFKKERAYG